MVTYSDIEYIAEYSAVRAVNASISRNRQLRVLPGDPPIDWDGMLSEQDRSKWKEWMALRDRHPADLVRREVLAKKRRALLIYGGTHCAHFQRKNLDTNFESVDLDLAQTVVSLLENKAATKVFSIWTNTRTDLQTLQPNVASWRKPSIAITRGTVLGATDFTSYVPPRATRFTIRDGKSVAVPRDQWRSLRMEDQFDAVLYLGPPSAMTFARVSTLSCSDPDYMAMRVRRMTLFGLKDQVDRLKRDCTVPIPS